MLASTGFLLARAGAESRRRFTQALATHGLTLAEFGVLMVLGEVGSAPQGVLGEQVGIDPRNLVPVIDELEARGYRDLPRWLSDVWPHGEAGERIEDR